MGSSIGMLRWVMWHIKLIRMKSETLCWNSKMLIGVVQGEVHVQNVQGEHGQPHCVAQASPVANKTDLNEGNNAMMNV
jgi:hypothetical protein